MYSKSTFRTKVENGYDSDGQIGTYGSRKGNWA